MTPKPEFVIPLRNVTIEEGSPCRLQCEVSIGDIQPSEVKVIWMRHGKPLPKAKHFKTGKL